MKPAKSAVIIDGILCKFEKDLNCIFKKTHSLSISADDLKRCEKVQVNMYFLDTIVEATREEIEAYGDVKIFHGETKYYYPCKLWRVIKGRNDWYILNTSKTI